MLALNPDQILVDIKYTSGKMNIHTRSTKCQYEPGNLDIVRVVIFRLQEQNHRRHDQPNPSA